MPDHDARDSERASTARVDPARPRPVDLAALPTFLRDRDPEERRAPRRLIVRAALPDEPRPITAAAVAALPVAGIPARRLVVIAIAVVLTWMVGSFGRQVAEASAVTARADQLRAATAALATEVAGLEAELWTVQDPRYIDGAARAYRLGTAREIAFALEVGAPPLGPDAPGSGSQRLGAEAASRSPFESWLVVLLGPAG